MTPALHPLLAKSIEKMSHGRQLTNRPGDDDDCRCQMGKFAEGKLWLCTYHAGMRDAIDALLQAAEPLRAMAASPIVAPGRDFAKAIRDLWAEVAL